MSGRTPNAVVSKVYTGTDATDAFTPGLGKFMIYVADSDNAVNATVVLEISVDGGTTWYIIETYTNTQTIKVAENWDPAAQFRLRVTAFTSATAGLLRLAA